MTRETPAVLLLGATGFTGRLVARALDAVETPVVLCARDPDRLKDVARTVPRAHAEVVDVTDEAALRRLIRPGDAVINTAGPFTELGEPVVRACVEGGAHYVDTTGEQPWMKEIHGRYHDRARSAGVAVANAMAFEYALGDCALALAAEGTDPVRADLVYAWGDAASSRGTRRTVIRMLGRRGYVLEDGRYRLAPQGARGRSVELASGARVRAVSFRCGEIVTGPRYLDIDSVHGWLVMGTWAARVTPLVAPALPVLVPLLLPLLEPLATRAEDPADAERAASGFTIRVELQHAAGSVALEVHGADPYGITAELAVRGALRAMEPDASRGVLAPSQLLDPGPLFEALRAHGIRLVREPAG